VPSQVREYVATELAQQLRPQLEAAVKANDDPAGEPYVFNAAACARRTMKNKALVGRGAVTLQYLIIMCASLLVGWLGGDYDK